MPLFVLMCFDKPGALELRLATRAEHLAYAGGYAGQIKFAGPMLDEAGEMAGSLFIMEAESLDAVKAFNAADPYQKAGVFERCEARGFRASIGNL